MQLERLETTYNYITEILRDGPNPRLERLNHDLFNHYYLEYNNLSLDCKRVWDVSINLRLKMVVVSQKKFSGYIATIKQMFSGYTSYPRIMFGQTRIGPTFQGAPNVNQQAMVGMPNVIGQGVVNYGQNFLNNPHMSDMLPVAIFFHNGHWIAANNRGFAAHCAGGVKPLRLLPRVAQVAEINRLNEVPGQGGIPQLQYMQGVPHLNQNPHTLPSRQMPITTGPNTWVVQAVVSVPQNWY
jgi:hypothetical protein